MTYSNRYTSKSKLVVDQESDSYEAWDSLLSRPVILKTVNPGLSDLESERFQKKYRRIATYPHPNLLKVYDFDGSDDQFGVVTELVIGESLKSICEEGLLSEEDFDGLVEQTLCWATSWEESGNGNVLVEPEDVLVARKVSDQFLFKVCNFEIVDYSFGEKRVSSSASDLLGSLANLFVLALTGDSPILGESGLESAADRLALMKNWMRLRRPDVSSFRTDWLSRLIVQVEEQAPISAREARVLFEKSGDSGDKIDHSALSQWRQREIDDEDETAPIPSHLHEEADDEMETAPIPLHLLEEDDRENTEVLEPLQAGKDETISVSFAGSPGTTVAARKWVAGIAAFAAAIILFAMLLSLPWSGNEGEASQSAEVAELSGPDDAPEVEEPEGEEVFAATNEANEEAAAQSTESIEREIVSTPPSPTLESVPILVVTDPPAAPLEPISPAAPNPDPIRAAKLLDSAKPQVSSEKKRVIVHSPEAPPTLEQKAAAEIAAITEALRDSMDGEELEVQERRHLVERMNALLELELENLNWAGADFDSLLSALIGEGSELEEPEIALLKKSATGWNSAYAAKSLAKYYRANDEGVAALFWLVAAAAAEDVDAMVESGLLLLSSDNSLEEQREGFSWLNRAAELGNEGAHYLVGECLLLGKGTPKQEAEAVRYLRKGIESGDARAFDLLGVCHTEGLGVEVDFDQARILFQQAIDHGNESALANLSVLYLNGEIAETDGDSLAVALLERGANQENRNCLFLLGQCHEEGIGLEKDVAQARELYERAAIAGSKQATELLKTFSKSG